MFQRLTCVASVLLTAFAIACGGGETIRYEDRGGSEVIVDCSGDDPQIRFADTQRPTMDYYQDARKACARLKK